MSNIRNKYIDYLKALLCIAVLLYHLNIIPGGYLAVCGFFVISGFLTCNSIIKNDNFNLGRFYLKRLIRLYIPLIVVVFISVGIISNIKDIFWVSLKPETTSVLLGYNNFWQITANMDYFAAHTDSPFMHLWYIAILLQLTLIAPLVILPLKKLSKTKGIKLSFIISLFISIILCGLFIYFYNTSGMMNVYYNTLSRAFSYFFGITISFASLLFSIEKNKLTKRIPIVLELTLIYAFINISSDNKYFAWAMIVTSIFTCICILLESNIENDSNIIYKILKYISDISYEVYLLQYPFIYLVEYFIPNGNIVLSSALVIVLTIFTASILHLCFTKYKNKLVWLFICILLVLSSFGCYKYVIAKDYSEDIAKLEEQLTKNQELLNARQAEYQNRAKQENDEWLEKLAELDASDEDIAKMVYELPIVCVGDSVMLGASIKLCEDFENIYCDAKVSRTGWVVPEILQDLKDNDLLSNTVVLGLGTNGNCPNHIKDEIMDICSDGDVYWITVTNDQNVHVNANLKEYCDEHDNAHLVDWYTRSLGHSEYFAYDGIHLTSSGREAYSILLHETISEVYKQEYEKQKEIVIAQHEEERNRKISFWGNELMLNLYENIDTDYEIYGTHIYNQDNINEFSNDFINSINNDELTRRVLLVFDSSAVDSFDTFDEIINLSKDSLIYVVKIGESDNIDLIKDYDNVTIIDFTDDLSEHSEYMFADGKHLSEQGNIALGKVISDSIR